MRRSSRNASDYLYQSPTGPINGRQTLRRLAPYLLQFRGRVLLALSCLIAAKLSNVAVPIVFKTLIDEIGAESMPVVLPVTLLVLYGLLRASNSLFAELREIIFARVTQRAVRRVALEVFRHLHDLSLRFHLERQTGGVARDIDRGTRAITSLISYTLYSILPTLVEISLVLSVLFVKYDAGFVLITVLSLTAYIAYTVTISNRRMAIRRQVNETDSIANTQAIDSLINYETVKYFNNEEFEARRYDSNMEKWEDATTRSQISLSLLNIGQQAIIAVGVTAMMWRAAAGVLSGQLTIGDLVLVNAFLIQLYMPLNFLGIVYREIRQSLTDIERMFKLLGTRREVVDAPDAVDLPHGDIEVRFENVDFAYDAKRPILFGVDFVIPAGKTVAVVGKSGSGKSTLARLLYRFYDVSGGAIRINQRDLREFRQASVRAAIGIVPQDTVLFNESIFYNIHYGRPGATHDEVLAAAQAAQLTEFAALLPDGLATVVGERGLKLSGGEKQRVAIARALLKDPSLLIFDEATSALDSKTEKAIQASLDLATRGRTTLIIAHRLSTIMNADQILVMDAGRIVERGTHAELLRQNGRYAQMWAMQQHDAGESGGPSRSDDRATLRYTMER
ncbi:ABC transporter ATP-binding protein/permease [uncultured Propionivibrio sp.]|uniref:ABCB family ABC transporter ATP-binding protein/permease n=1 Tax=uncultured Propionivibrio sp. TaxID=426737 RepID=UPI0029BFD7FB|nr:ABC transporter ATP-binding protein/permease [uncultured Propionivibrio sp.]